MAERSSPATSPASGVKIVLTMILGNEEKIIARCIQSCLGQIDAAVFCCNGKDTTDVVAAETATKHNLAHKIHRVPWRNFRENRSESFLLGREAAREWGFKLDRTYLLMLDGDMMLTDAVMPGHSMPASSHLRDDESLPGLRRLKLTLPGYKLRQLCGTSDYTNMRLLRLDVDWKCVRRTHEYWECPEALFKQCQESTFPYIDDKDDGGSKGDKYERDIVFLKQDLEDDPKDSRSPFYLGQTYYYLAQREKNRADDTEREHNKARRDKEPQIKLDELLAKTAELRKKSDEAYRESTHWYQRCIACNGWKAESWFSHYGVCRNYIETDDLENGLLWAMKAYKHTPERAEPLWRLAHAYRNKGDNTLAHLYASRAKRVPYPQGDHLFIDRPVYLYKIDLELSIVCFYLKELDEGREISERLLRRNDLNGGERYMVRSNLVFYMSTVAKGLNLDADGKRQDDDKLRARMRYHPLSIALPSVMDGTALYRPMNPSLLRDFTWPDGLASTYLVNLRTVNYVQNKCIYTIHDDDGVVRTRNFLLGLDGSFNIQRSVELVDTFHQEAGDRVKGYEDVRVFRWNRKGSEEIWCLATVRVTHDLPEQALCRIEISNKEAKFVERYPLVPRETGKVECEKNWMIVPPTSEDHLDLIYTHDPLVVVRFDAKGQLLRRTERGAPFHMSSYRGSASPILLPDGTLLGLVHEVVARGSSERIYIHRWIRYAQKDDSLSVTHVSDAFRFRGREIEYSCGITLSPDSADVIVGMGFEDRDAALLTLPLAAVTPLLRSV